MAIDKKILADFNATTYCSVYKRYIWVCVYMYVHIKCHTGNCT